MKVKPICLYLCTASVFICVCLQLGIGQQDVTCRPQNRDKSAPKYRIGYRERTKSTPSILVVHISIEPKHFNRTDMSALARRLNEDFSKEPQLNAVICDEFETAKEPGIIYDLLRREPPLALRGFYELDRASRKEGISFSTARGKPLDEVDIDLSKER